MPKKLGLKEVSEEESQEIGRLVRSCTAAVRLVQRAKVIQAMSGDPKMSTARAGRLAGYQSDFSGQLWGHRFNTIST